METYLHRPLITKTYIKHSKFIKIQQNKTELIYVESHLKLYLAALLFSLEVTTPTKRKDKKEPLAIKKKKIHTIHVKIYSSIPISGTQLTMLCMY